MLEHPENTRTPSIDQLEQARLLAQRRLRFLSRADMGVGMLAFCCWAFSGLLTAYAHHLMGEPTEISLPNGSALGYFLAGLASMAIGLGMASKCWKAIEAATAHWTHKSAQATEALTARSEEAAAIKETKILTLALGPANPTTSSVKVRRI